MAARRGKRNIPGITFGGNLLPSPDDFIRYAKARKARERKKSSLESFKTMILGEKGMGKAVIAPEGSVITGEDIHLIDETIYPPSKEVMSLENRIKHIDDKEEEELQKRNRLTLMDRISHQNISDSTPTGIRIYAQASGGGGGSGGDGGGSYIPTSQQPPWSNQPASQQTGYWSQSTQPDWLHPSGTIPQQIVNDTVPEQKPKSKKQEFSVEDHRGKFCAVATVTTTHGDITIEHTGVLFVKKCGHWKLMEFNGDKLGGGNAGSFEGDIRKGRMKIEVHKILYDAEYVEPELGVDELEIS
jgi:hypothetical protein